MASLTDILSSPLFQTGVNLYNQYQLGQGAKDAVNQTNQGFKQAVGAVTDFGNKSLDAINQGSEQARTDLQGYSEKASGYQQPFYDAGLAALSEYQNLLSNPSQVLSDPGVNFQYEQGLETVNRALDSNRLLNSGARLNAATEYGQGFASTALDSALGRQSPLMNMGQTAGNNLSTINQNTGVSLANLAQNTGQNIANVNQGMGTSIANLRQGQNENLANKNISDSIRNTGLLDVLSSPQGIAAAGQVAEAVGGLINGAGMGSLGESVAGLFGGGATSYAAPAWGNELVPGGIQATPLPPGVEAPPIQSTPTIANTPAAINAVNIGGAIKGADAFMQSGSTGSLGDIGATAGAVAGSLVPLAGPVTGAAGAMLGGTVGNFAQGIYNSVTGQGNRDWALRYDANGEGVIGKESFTTPLGTFGFSARQTRNMGEEDKREVIQGLQEQFTQMDTVIANALTPEELNMVRERMNGFEAGQGANQVAKSYSRDPVLAFTKKRLEALKSTLGPERIKQSGLDQVIEDYNAQFPEAPDQKTAIRAGQIAYQLSQGSPEASNAADMLETQYPGLIARIQQEAQKVDPDDVRNETERWMTAANYTVRNMASNYDRYRV